MKGNSVEQLVHFQFFSTIIHSIALIVQLYILRSIYNKNCFYPYQSQRLGTICDLINVFSLLTEIVHNMPSIFVIGKGISEVKKL